MSWISPGPDRAQAPSIISEIVSVSPVELAQRRRKLRQRRRIRLLQSCWRILAVTSLAGSLVWITTLPAWVIRRSDQVKIEGNQYIPVQTIRSRLPIPYPQSLWRIEPQRIATELQATVPLAEVVVSRQLFPPGLIVQLKERYPVAIAISPTSSVEEHSANSPNSKLTPASHGLLDESGTWIPLESYTSLNQSLKLPTLKVIGSYAHYQPFWANLYQDVRRSPVKISEIDWRDTANVILTTELGTVHMGSYTSQFAYQLTVLDKMRKLPNYQNSHQFDYIDLRNPNAPTAHLDGSKDSVDSEAP